MKNNTALLSIGFRPFFLLASFFSFFAMSAWVVVYLSSQQLAAFKYYPMTVWHAHEMVFGYSMAVIAGFLLTAIKNWTKIQTVNGVNLILLSFVWIAGRMVSFVTDIGAVIAFVDMLFLPILAVFIAMPLIKAGNKRNYFIIVLIMVFAALNLLVHLELLGMVSNISNSAIKTSFYLIIALIIIMAGRVFPMFSQNGVTNRYEVKKYKIIEKLAVPSYLIFIFAIVFIKIQAAIFVTGILATIVHAVRLKGWYNSQIWQVPLVWVLHVGYFFLITGIVLTNLSAQIPALYFLALHAFSIGTIGIITIGMMARVSIGHTGRDLSYPPKAVKWIFIMIVLATIVRSIVPIFVSDIYHWTIIVSGLLWSFAFLIFMLNYIKMWTKPRLG